MLYIIKLIDNKIGDNAITTIHHNMKKMPKLTQLNMSDVVLNAKSVKILVYHYLTRNNQLKFTFKSIYIVSFIIIS